MPNDSREPQSYGSEKEWTTGKTGQTVNEQASTPAPEHRPFYDDRRETEDSEAHQGGDVSPVQLTEHAAVQHQTSTSADITPLSGVKTDESGAKRGSYFRTRDYE